MRIGVFGLGEAGAEIATGLARGGATVIGYDPAEVATPGGVERVATPGQAVADAGVVIAVTAAADAPTALSQAIDQIPTGAHYADFATAAPALKRDLCDMASASGLLFTDVAIMGAMPGRGIEFPAVASGPGAEEFGPVMDRFGLHVDLVGPEPGEAAQRKLLRSVAIKGMAAAVIESMAAAEAAGLADEVYRSIVGQLEDADGAFLDRLIDGTGAHAKRRHDEMLAAADLLTELGVDGQVTAATISSLERIRKQGLPPMSGGSRE